MSNGPIPESPENSSRTQLPTAAGHLIAKQELVAIAIQPTDCRGGC